MPGSLLSALAGDVAFASEKALLAMELAELACE
jgi:hypothetical protein